MALSVSVCRPVVGAALLVAAGWMLGSPRGAWGVEPAANSMVLAGSGSNLAITRVLAEAFRARRPEITIDVPPSIGSTGAVRAAADGSIALGLISRPLRERERGLGLTVLPYARAVIVIAAHATVADDSVTSEELVQIYRGTKTRWRNGREIIVLTREPGDSTIEVLERAVPGFKGAYAESQRAKRWRTLYTDQDMNRTLAHTPDAIGLSDLGAIPLEGLSIRPLAFNGVLPIPGLAIEGGYPLVKTLAFVFRTERLSAAARAFLDFARSKRAQQILASYGYLPGE